jgi:Uma2 family endonuclease
MIQKLKRQVAPRNDYPTGDGKPMAETTVHRRGLTDLIDTLERFYSDDLSVCVNGNLLVFYESGNKRKHLSPDVFVVKEVGNHERENYLLWEEAPLDLVIELTSKTTKSEDVKKKYQLYESKLGVKEYFLFDPKEDYLHPSLQGYRNTPLGFVAISEVNGRLPSEVLGLHLERSGEDLRLWNPITGKWEPTTREAELAEKQRADKAENELKELKRKLAEGK